LQTAATAGLGTPSPSLASHRILAELGLGVPGRRPLLLLRFELGIAVANRRHLIGLSLARNRLEERFP